MEYSIGEFSKIARVSVKALRLYHEKGLLSPDFIDPESGYRYYRGDQTYEIQVIHTLKEMGFSLGEIKSIIEELEDDSDLIEILDAKRKVFEKQIQSFRQSITKIETIINIEKNVMNAEDLVDQIEEKHIPDMLVAGHRMTGRYDEIGKGFSILGRHAGRFINGKAMCLYYDGEYREEADFEPFFEVKKEVSHEKINCRVLEGGRALTVLHQGPYDRLGDSYKILMDFAKAEGIAFKKTSREVFLKGPGMILKGNPEKYLTEIQMFVEGK